MSASHTQGPWTSKGTRVYGIDSELVAMIGYRLDAEEEAANVALVKAAPELLEALQEIVRSIEGGGNIVTFSDADTERYRAALSKATQGEAR